MAKVALVFSCKTSYGGSFERVMDTDRNWWIREYKYNGYGMAWGKWECTEAKTVTYRKDKLTMWDGAVRTDRVAVIENGFQADVRCVLSRNGKRYPMPKYRLPKV